MEGYWQSGIYADPPKHCSALERTHNMVSEIDYLHELQWPAMVVTVLAAWLIASQSRRKREMGFWFFLLSNVLWIIWGWYSNAYALVTLQFALAILNFRGVYKNETSSAVQLEA
jgi:hypothetical protein